VRGLRALALCLVCSAGAGQAAPPAPPVEVEGCAGVLVRIADPSELAAGEGVAAHLCRAREALEARLPGVLPRVRVRAWVARDMQEFRARTGRAAYIAAAVHADEIITQPGRGLARVEDLGQVLAHELCHLVLRRLAGPGLPRWLEEGLAQHLPGAPAPAAALPAGEDALLALEQRLGAPDAPDEAGRQARAEDYRAALACVERLSSQVGLERLVRGLPGLVGPDWLGRELAGRPLRAWLFPPPARTN